MRLQMRRDGHRIISIDIVYGAVIAVGCCRHRHRRSEFSDQNKWQIVDIIVPSFISFHQFVSLFSVSFLCVRAICARCGRHYHRHRRRRRRTSFNFGSNLNVFQSIQNHIKITIIRSAKPVLLFFFSLLQTHIFIHSHTYYYSIEFGEFALVVTRIAFF